MFYNRQEIEKESVKVFQEYNKKKNDENNAMRESIVSAIINDKVPEEYYEEQVWVELKHSIQEYIKKLKETLHINECAEVICIPKGGRMFHYDFLLIFDKITEIRIEFKFNANEVNDCPQFVSPGKPSRFMSMNYEEWFYENGLKEIASYGNLELPDKEVYLKTIHNNKVEVMREYKEKYDTDTNFKRNSKKIDKLTNKKYLTESKLDTKKLSEYLIDTQQNKRYMCFNPNDGKFYDDTLDKSLYEIDEVCEIKAPNIICKTKKGYKLEIKLRWKNGNGIQYPAFQISRKIPTKAELIKICKENEIEINTKIVKKLIVQTLTDSGIIF